MPHPHGPLCTPQGDVEAGVFPEYDSYESQLRWGFVRKVRE